MSSKKGQDFYLTPDQIRAAREAHGWTREVMAEKLEVSPVTVKKWEYGERTPCCRHMRREVRKALGIKLSV